MMQKIRLIGVMVLLFLLLELSGCSSISRANLTQAKTGYITDIDDILLLVNDTYFSADKNTEVVSDTGKQMKFSDLAIGVMVKPWFEGAFANPFQLRQM